MSHKGEIGHGSYEEFQGRIDAAFNKSDPAASIPWSIEAPSWAAHFQPRRIIDLGSARAHFTSSVLHRLGNWGRLGRLEELTLVEGDPSIDHGPNGSHYSDAANRCTEVLQAYGADQALVSIVGAQISLENVGSTDGAGSSPRLVAAGKPLPEADLLIASHFTYYFPQLESQLLKAISKHLTADGLAWLVIRRRDCPIYRARARELGRLGLGHDQDESYAEDFERLLVAPGSPLQVREARTLNYLAPSMRPDDCVDLAHLLMWRSAPEASEQVGDQSAALAACRESGPLFSERHLVLAKVP